MQFFTVVALFASALAAPTDFKAQMASPLCPSGLLYGIPTCCSTNVLNIASLDCSVPSRYPDAMNTFRSVCGAVGRSPVCCSIPLAGLGVLCTPAIGA